MLSSAVSRSLDGARSGMLWRGSQSIFLPLSVATGRSAGHTYKRQKSILNKIFMILSYTRSITDKLITAIYGHECYDLNQIECIRKLGLRLDTVMLSGVTNTMRTGPISLHDRFHQ
jgi:hypothetical protein